MFISAYEKNLLKNQIASLNLKLSESSDALSAMETRFTFWEAKVRAMEGQLNTLYAAAAAKRKRAALTPEQRERQRGYARKYYARKRAERELEKA